MSETDDDQCNCEARRCEMEDCSNCAVGNLPFCSAHCGDDEPRRRLVPPKFGRKTWRKRAPWPAWLDAHISEDDEQELTSERQPQHFGMDETDPILGPQVVTRKRCLSFLPQPHLADVEVERLDDDTCEETDEVCRLDGIQRKRKASSRNATTRTRTILKDKRLNDESIGEAKGFTCKCETQCADKVSRADISSAREAFWNLKQDERLQYLVNQLMFDATANHEEATLTFRTTINGITVCGPFYKKALGISQQMYANARTRIRTRHIVVLPKESETNLTNKRDTVVSFLKRYVEEHGQAVPNQDIRELPIGLTRCKLYVVYVSEEFEAAEISAGAQAKLSSFYLYLTQFPALKFRKWMTFSQCSICSELKSNIEKAKSKEEKGEFFRIR